MNVALAIFVVIGFAVTIEYFALPERARTVGERGLSCLDVLQNASMSDREKEAALQKQAGRLFGLLGILLGGSALALGGPIAGIWVLDQMGIGSLNTVLSILQRLDFLAGTVIGGVLLYVIVSQLRSS